MKPNLAQSRLCSARARIHTLNPLLIRGRVVALTGLALRAYLPAARMGDFVWVHAQTGARVGAEVIGFDGHDVVLMPLGQAIGIGPRAVVEASGETLQLRCGPGLLGRILDGLGHPADDRGPLTDIPHAWPLERRAPDPLTRPRIREPLSVGVRAIDGVLTLGQGQRVGLFAGSGVGKTTLLGQIAQYAEVDIVVVCLVGERGREVRSFISDALGEGLQRSVVVCATSDEPPLVRLKAAHTATAVAEYFRAQGKRVLLMMDSVTRYARALREVALAGGEPPARRGYPPSVFAKLPLLLERCGTAPEGSITAIYTVLVEGDDTEEPVADEVRGILDGHIILSRRLAERGHWPAIDVQRSISRVMVDLVSADHQRAAERLRALLSAYDARADLIAVGAYQRGTDPITDQAIDAIAAITQFLRQSASQHVTAAQTQQALIELVSANRPATTGRRA